MKQKLLKVLGVFGLFALSSCNLTIINENSQQKDQEKTSDVVVDDSIYLVSATEYNSAINYLQTPDFKLVAKYYNEEKKDSKQYSEVTLEKDGNNYKAVVKTFALNQETTTYYVYNGTSFRQFSLENNTYVESNKAVDADKLIETSYLTGVYANLQYNSKTNTYSLANFKLEVQSGDTTINETIDAEIKFEYKRIVSLDAYVNVSGYKSVTSIEINYGASAFVLPAEVEALLKQ